MHSYNPCLFLFSAQVACLSTAAPTEYLLVSVAWFACSCACLCVNCVNGSSQRGTRILVKCAHWKARVGLSVGREERTTTRTHTLTGLLSNALAWVADCGSAPVRLFWALLGCFLCPVAPRTKLRTQKEQKSLHCQRLLLILTAALVFVDWSSSSSPRCSSSLYTCKEHEHAHKPSSADCSPMARA